MNIKIGVINVSDRASAGIYEDIPGKAVVETLKEYLVSEFETVYKDTFKFKKKYQIIIDENTKVIQLKPEMLSKNLSITNVLPSEINSLNHLRN